MGPNFLHDELLGEKKLPLFASPLKMHRKQSDETDLVENGFGLGETMRERKYTMRRHEEELDELPEFQRHEEATNVELFYDLFFVANLTTFSSIHEINDIATLSSYIGFFCILWFTWCQVSSFDVRFIADSIVERCAKAIHMGVMVGMATVGPNFDTHAQHSSSLKTMALVLMVSRLILALQYLSVGWHVRKHKNTKVPFALIAIVNFSTAFIYLGVSFAFGVNGRSLAYRSFYVLAVFEIVCNIVISIVWKVLTFKHTHLVQRMSLLTLIILGEGVIVVSKNIAKIVQKKNAWDTATIGTLTAAIGIIYFLYILYFDALPSRHFGSTRQQIWAFLHFPFHLCLILFMEGTAAFVIWHKMWDVASTFYLNLATMLHSTTDIGDGQAVGGLIQNFTNTFLTSYPPVYTEMSDQIDAFLATVELGFNSTFNQTQWEGTATNLATTVMHSVFETYGFEIPELANGTAEDPSAVFQADFNVIGLVYIYFFAAAGLTLIMMGILNFITLPKSTWTRDGLRHPGAIVRYSAFFIMGTGLGIFAVSVLYQTGFNLAVSPWLLPIATFVVFAVLLAQYVPLPGQKSEVPWA